MAKNVHVGHNILRLQLWDTAGQERFRSLIPSYLKDASVAFIVFDITSTLINIEISVPSTTSTNGSISASTAKRKKPL
jgi:GTPase SAR1 family protein